MFCYTGKNQGDGTRMAPVFLPQIDSRRCIGCEPCVKLCPNQALALQNDRAVVAKPSACDYSAVCQEICPTEAISLTYEIICSGKEAQSMPYVT
jgi:formate hydrogenlyase subunit 6/NADH:ubiquinone oxidoreductase subunit I